MDGMEKDNYARIVGDIIVDASKVLIMSGLLYVGARDYLKSDHMMHRGDMPNDMPQKTYLMASRGSQEISDMIDSAFKSSSRKLS